MVNQDFLFELGSEELPPKALKVLADALRQSFAAQLNDNKVTFESLDVFASPRRLALRAHSMEIGRASCRERV